ncbi:RHS repeat-associated core domain-containing protein [Nocardioides nitrophenolicus]|uniref:RHS repeat-associated core domain-containing protein n=1 Tax=Nocardioides nitrophenolicus TaxID=60489 RepID=UPI000ABB4BAD|nr:RHS repeat-associated core domain-containing protein [Nocardioides nitrophenolicus]MBM7518653.1 RHS repeat-associated protein [Nocardioides nitrophenolicus]
MSFGARIDLTRQRFPTGDEYVYIDDAAAAVRRARIAYKESNDPNAKKRARGLTRDGSTGTYQMGTRTYEPDIAAFTTPDSYRVASPSTDLSVGTDPLTANTHTYVNGNPVNMTDPDGPAGVSGRPGMRSHEDRDLGLGDRPHS